MTPPDCENVLVSCRDDQARLRALALEHRVGARRCAVVDIFEFAVPVELLLQNLASLLDALLHADRLVGNVRRDLGADRLSIRRDDADICECAVVRLSQLSGSSGYARLELRTRRHRHQVCIREPLQVAGVGTVANSKRHAPCL